MQSKLYPNMKRMTSTFCLGIVCVTLSVLTLRLTVFSDMASAPAEKPGTASRILSNEQDGYKINQAIYFATAGSKGDVFIANLEGNEYLIKVDIKDDQTGNVVLATGFINPGHSMDKTRMNTTGQKLRDGMYSCTAEITAHAQDSLKAVGSVSVPVKIYVGERPEKPVEAV